MPTEAPTAGGGQERLQFSDASGCAAWLARLPRANPAQCHALLAAQARLLPAAAVAAAAKFEILELLREPVAEAQLELAKNFRGMPLPLAAKENEAWNSTVGMWRAMAAGYDALIDAMATTAPGLATQAHVICQRALRYTAAAMFEYGRIYHSVGGSLWQQLHRLYVFCENAGLVSATINDGVGRQAPGTTCAATYAHALLIHLAQPDTLTVEQIDIADRWLDRWGGLVSLSPELPPQSGVPALAVDLSSQKGAGPAQQMPSASVRYLNLEPLGNALRQAAAALKQQTPAQLGLGDLPREACEQLLLHIGSCAAGTGRVDERTPASIKVMISPNIASMHFHLTGKAFRQPGGELTAAERQRLDMFGSVPEAGEKALASQRSAALETWVIVNQSIAGFLATVREKEVVNRISHHQLVALRSPAKKVMYLGVVQRLSVDDAGTIWVGLRIIPGVPQAVAVRVADAAPGNPAAGEYNRALLMPEDAARKIPASIVLLPGWYQPNRTLTLIAEKEKERKIRLQGLLDKGNNFENATYIAS